MTKRRKGYFFIPTKTDTQDGKRFLTKDKPEEPTYRDLTDSVPFFLEEEDRAKESSQGLVHKATNSEAKTYDETELTTKTKAVISSQLPEIKPNLTEIAAIESLQDAYSGNSVEVDIATSEQDPNASKRNVFLIRISNSFIAWIRQGLIVIKNFQDEILSNINLNGGSANQVLVKNSSANGDYAWKTVLEKIYLPIEINGTGSTSFILPFNATISVVANDGATVVSPTLPFTYTTNTLFTINLSGVNNNITLLITQTV